MIVSEIDMGKLNKKIGNKIKQIRIAKGIKQFALAEKLNMEPSNLTRIESGYQFPKEENLQKIADNLNVDVKDIFDFTDELSKDEILKRLSEILYNFDLKQLKFLYEYVKLYMENC